jgi:Tol biopolymer transport system component
MNVHFLALVSGAFLIASTSLSLAGIEAVSLADPALASGISGNGLSATPDLSPDGRFVVFSSSANNITPDDNNVWLDVFLRDRQSGTTTLISANTNGLGGNGYSGSPSLSTNGAWVAFESDASDLTDGDTNRTSDVFVRNTTLGLTTLVSVNTNGTSANGASTFPIITPDGRFVAFESTATDLVTNNCAGGIINIYLRDLVNNTTALASVSTNELDGGNGNSTLSGVSPDGRYVLFSSAANNLGSIKNDWGEVFLRDVLTQQTYWVSGDLSQSLGVLAECFNPVMSGDGRIIAFRGENFSGINFVARYDIASQTTQLISSNQHSFDISKADHPGPSISQDGSVIAYMNTTFSAEPNYTNNKQIYVWDAASQTNMLVSAAPDGIAHANSNSSSPVLSADGRTLAFLSLATNLDVNTPATSRGRIYIRNLVTGVTKLASLETNSNKPQEDDIEDPVLSADGSLIVFESASDGLVENDNNGENDVFLNNTQNGATDIISTRMPALESATASASSFMPANGLSGDGRFVVFSTAANNLAAGDTNLQRDVYMRDRVTGKIQLVSVNANGTSAGNGASAQPSISLDGRLVVFQSTSSDLVAGDTNKQTDVFIRDMTTGQTRFVSVGYGTTESAVGNSDSPTITPDGHYVVFRSNAKNLTSYFYPTFVYDLYAYDTGTGTIFQISSATTPIDNPTVVALVPNSQYIAYFQKDGLTRSSLYLGDLSTHVNELITNKTQTIALPAFSGDGRWMAYLGANNNMVFRDLVAKTNTSLAVRTNVWSISLNGDGSRVAYSAGFAPAPCNKRQVFVYDRTTGSNILVSANLSGVTIGNGDSRNPIISQDGRYVYFNSRATDLVADTDHNGTTDVFVRDLATGTTRLLSVNRFKTGAGNNLTTLKALSADGQVVAMESFASDLVPMDMNMTKDVFVLRVNETTQDSDNDGLADSWETQYFGNLDCDGTGDFDNDGMSDGAEFLAGTDPTDKQSALIVTQIGKPDQTGRLITWTAVSGNSYKIQYKTHLNDAVWEELSGTIKAESAVASKLDDTTNASEQRFYRVLLVP